MTDKPAILVYPRHLGPAASLLEGAYTVYRFWEGPPTEVGHTIRAVITVGETPLDLTLLESLPELGLIAYFSTGHDSDDAAWRAARGVLASHCRGINHEDTADHALGLILASVRGIVAGDRSVRAGEWTGGAKAVGPSLLGKRVGIIGLGAIGAAVAQRCEALRMNVSWWGPRDKPGARWPRAASLIELARDSDILVVAAKADETTHGLISVAAIEALGPAGLLVNVSRGSLVDEDALIAALKEGTLGAAALDVFESEPTDPGRWNDVPNTILTPHSAGATQASIKGMFTQLNQNLRAFFAGEALVTPIAD